MGNFIEGFSVYGVKMIFNDNTLDWDSFREPVSFHFTESEAEQALTELEKTEHGYDELHVAPDSQYDP